MSFVFASVVLNQGAPELKYLAEVEETERAASAVRVLMGCIVGVVSGLWICKGREFSGREVAIGWRCGMGAWLI